VFYLRSSVAKSLPLPIMRPIVIVELPHVPSRLPALNPELFYNALAIS
jgi:hypothetical protein